MPAFILIAAATGMIASIASLVAGASVWVALALYIAAGVGSLLLVMLRALICDILEEAGMLGKDTGTDQRTNHSL